MINAEDDVIVNIKTSCSKGEAVAMLLGWLRGSIQPRAIAVTEYGVSPDQLPFLQSLEGSLQQQLQEQVDMARLEFLASVESGADEEEIIRKELVVEERHNLVKEAARYARDIDEELNSLDSELRLDEFKTDKTREQYILIGSLDKWAIGKYGISILDEELDDSCAIVDTETSTESAKPDCKEGLSDKSERSLYLTLALLVNEFAKTSGTVYRKGDDLNISQIANRLNRVFENLFEKQQHASGQGSESIRTRLTVAKRIFCEDIPDGIAKWKSLK
jgi:hypothetical protein